MGIEAQVYERHFKINSDGTDIGVLMAVKRVSGDISQYELESEVSTTLRFRVNLVNKIQANFEGEVLMHSSSTTYLNGEVFSKTEIQKTADGYSVKKDGHETKIFDAAISFSSAKLYFQEPGESVKTLSESEGYMKSLEKVGDKKYELRVEGNKTDAAIYSYSSDQGLHQIAVEQKQLPDLKISGIRHADEMEE